MTYGSSQRRGIIGHNTRFPGGDEHHLLDSVVQQFTFSIQ